MNRKATCCVLAEGVGVELQASQRNRNACPAGYIASRPSRLELPCSRRRQLLVQWAAAPELVASEQVPILRRRQSSHQIAVPLRACLSRRPAVRRMGRHFAAISAAGIRLSCPRMFSRRAMCGLTYPPNPSCAPVHLPHHFPMRRICIGLPLRSKDPSGRHPTALRVRRFSAGLRSDAIELIPRSHALWECMRAAHGTC